MGDERYLYRRPYSQVYKQGVYKLEDSKYFNQTRSTRKMRNLILKISVSSQEPDLIATLARIERDIESAKKYSSKPAEALYLIGIAALEELSRRSEEINLQTCGYLSFEDK